MITFALIFLTVIAGTLFTLLLIERDEINKVRDAMARLEQRGMELYNLNRGRIRSIRREQDERYDWTCDKVREIADALSLVSDLFNHSAVKFAFSQAQEELARRNREYDQAAEIAALQVDSAMRDYNDACDRIDEGADFIDAYCEQGIEQLELFPQDVVLVNATSDPFANIAAAQCACDNLSGDGGWENEPPFVSGVTG